MSASRSYVSGRDESRLFVVMPISVVLKKAIGALEFKSAGILAIKRGASYSITVLAKIQWSLLPDRTTIVIAT